MTNVYLLRHGETESGQCFRGSLDDELTTDGWQQMQLGVQKCPLPEVILTSPLKALCQICSIASATVECST